MKRVKYPRKMSLHNRIEVLNERHKSTRNLDPDLVKNEALLRDIFRDCSDVVFRPISSSDHLQVLVIYVDGFIDTSILDNEILKSILFDRSMNIESSGEPFVPDGFNFPIGQMRTVSMIHEVIEFVMKGYVAILRDGQMVAGLAEVKKLDKRAVEEPSVESLIRGPREGFTESLRTNTALIRTRIPSPQLKLESVVLGDITKTDVVIVYFEGMVQQRVLDEVRKRIRSIEVDSVLESGYVEEMIEDSHLSPFPQMQATERPDTVAASLLEGKVSVLVNGTPFALIMPMTFWSALQSADDHYQRFLYSNAIRCLRLFMLFIALLLPSTYVALTTFHPQMIPTSLLLSIAAAREGIPFPAVIEAMMMEFMFEGLREAGVRLPKAVGSAVSIVGALVIGQAAVEAGIISAPMVIVVATTGIASFTIPRYNFGIAFRLLRFPMLILAGTLGFYGISAGLLAIMSHLIMLKSFGVPYMSPVAPSQGEVFQDAIIRAPHRIHRASRRGS